jgi:multidrug efflux pump subunit AcrB/outer membrane protein TolC
MEERKVNMIELAMRHKQIVFLLIVITSLFGMFALWVMPRNEFPEFVVRQGLIIGLYPGATSNQIEERLTNKVESFLFGFQEVNRDKTYSISKEGVMLIMVEVNTNVKDPDAFWDKIQFGLSNLKKQLPPQVIALNADNDFGNTSALLLTVHSEQRNYKQLEHYVNAIETELRKIQSISKIKHYGLQQEQISIYLNPDRLATYGVRPATILAAMQLEGTAYYGGEINNEQLIMPLHVPPNYNSERDIAQQIIYTDPNGNIVRLKDIATIKREYVLPESLIKNNGKNSLLISLEMQPGTNMVQFGKEVDESLLKLKRNLPDDLIVAKTADMPSVVNYAIEHFLKEFLIAICGVVLVVMLMLPFRIASVAGATIPVIIFISIGILYLLRIELNTVSLAGLVVVLGMVVDDAIVVIDNHLEKLDHGLTPWDAAWKSATELFVPVLTATLAIIITFLPTLFFLTGMIGDFVYALPVTIAVALTISLIVAYFVVPYISFTFIKKGIKRSEEVKKNKNSIFNYLQKAFDASLVKAFRIPKLTVTIGFSSFLFGIFLIAIMPRQLFPKVERNQFAVEIYLPEGLALEQTGFVTDSLSQMLLHDKRVVNVTSFTGASSPRFHTTYAPNFPSKNYAQLIVNTTTEESAVELMTEYENKKRNYFPNAYVRIKQLDMMPTAAPIEVRLAGSNIDSLKIMAEKVMEIMKGKEEVIWARTDYLNPRQGVEVELNNEVANRLGFSKGMVANSLATGFSGASIGTVWEGDYPVNIKLINEKERRNSFDDIENQTVTSPLLGTTVPVSQIANLTNDWSEGQIVRKNGLRTITVRADLRRDALAYKVLDDIRPKIENIQSKAITVSYGGERQNEYENYIPLSKSLATSMVLIFFILLFQFKKFRLVFLIMTTIPLGIFGAAIGLMVTGYPFGLTVFLGLMSLMGIVVRNGIILVDYAEELRTSQLFSSQEAAMASAKRRMRPIFLTSAAGAVGVVPMMLSGSSLWGPLATVIFFGLMFSMIFSLYVLPVMYHLLLKRDSTQHKISSKMKGLHILTIGILSSATAFSQQVLTLQESIDLALKNNFRIKNSMLETTAAKQNKKDAFTNYFPKVTATALGFYSVDKLIQLKNSGGNLPVYDGNPQNIPIATQFAYLPPTSTSMLNRGFLGSVNIIQPIFTGGQIITGNKLAQISMEIKELQQMLSKNEIILKTEQQYWLVFSLQEKQKYLKKGMELLAEINKQVNDSYKSGLIVKNDVLKVEIKQSEMQLSKNKLNNGKKLALMQFCQTIGTPFDSTLVLIDSVPLIQNPENYYTTITDALPRRTEFKLLEKSLEAEKLQTRLKKADYFPKMAVGATGFYLNALDNGGKLNGMGFATVSVPVSALWTSTYSLKERKIKEEIQQNIVTENQQQLQLQMQKALMDLQEAFAQIALAKKIQEQSFENLKVNSDSYKNGFVTVSDLLEAQAMQLDASNKLLEAHTNYQTAITNYLLLTGR